MMNEASPWTYATRPYGHWVLAAGITIGLLVLGVAWAKISREPTHVVRPESALLVDTDVARQAPSYSLERVFIGRVEPARESDIGFELGGKVLEVLVDEGDAVQANQVLARLDVDRLRAQRDELTAERAQTRAKLALAKVTLKRIEGLVNTRHASRQELDEAQENFRSQQAGVRLAESRLRTIDVDLEKSALRAPFPAIVTERLVDEGRVLATGEPILRLLEAKTPEARIGVAGRTLAAVQPGQSHRVSVNGQNIAATVKAVLPVRGASTRTVDVILTLAARPQDVRPGDLLRFTLHHTVPEPGFWLPLSALTEGTRGLWSSYIAEPVETAKRDGATHRLVRRTVEILHEASDRVFVRGTLKEGDVLVTDGLHRIVPGQLVRVANPADFETAEREDEP